MMTVGKVRVADRLTGGLFGAIFGFLGATVYHFYTRQRHDLTWQYELQRREKEWQCELKKREEEWRWEIQKREAIWKEQEIVRIRQLLLKALDNPDFAEAFRTNIPGAFGLSPLAFVDAYLPLKIVFSNLEKVVEFLEKREVDNPKTKEE